MFLVIWIQTSHLTFHVVKIHFWNLFNTANNNYNYYFLSLLKWLGNFYFYFIGIFYNFLSFKFNTNLIPPPPILNTLVTINRLLKQHEKWYLIRQHFILRQNRKYYFHYSLKVAKIYFCINVLLVDCNKLL